MAMTSRVSLGTHTPEMAKLREQLMQMSPMDLERFWDGIDDGDKHYILSHVENDGSFAEIGGNRDYDDW